MCRCWKYAWAQVGGGGAFFVMAACKVFLFFRCRSWMCDNGSPAV